MTAIRRFVSGSIAGWVGIAVVTLNQVALVPLYLLHWTVDEFGVWLIVQAIFSFSTVVSFGYATYLEYEFFKLGGRDPVASSRLLYSSIPVALTLALLETLVILILVSFGAIEYLLSNRASLPIKLIHDAGLLLVVQSVNSFIFVCTTGLVQRALVPLGYYPRNAWWYAAGSLVSTLALAAAVLMGASFLQAGVVQALAYSLFSMALGNSLWKILRAEKIYPVHPEIALGLSTVLPSLAVAAKTLLSMLQQQGIRILLAGAIGMRDLASFASMRTISNVALQSIGTVVNPLAPELIRFANNRDSERVQASFGVMWVLAVVVLSFFLIVLQWVAPWLFRVWTLGKIAFDPLVFSGLSVALLVFGLSQPVLTIVRGSNQLRAQLSATVIGALIMVTAIYFFTKSIGLLAVTLGIILSEIASMGIYARSAKLWMDERQLAWPTALFNSTMAFAMVGAIGILATALGQQYAGVITLSVCGLQLLLSHRLWKTLPSIVQQRVLGISIRLRSPK